LSFHAPYRCRHAGACCTSNWPIPIEADRLVRLRGALATGALRYAIPGVAPVIPIESRSGAPGEVAALLGRTHGQCVFFEDAPASGSGRCRIHTALGHDALPVACRQFPRVSVLDPRGVSVALSHYCPTAAGLLDAEVAAGDAGIALKVDSPAFPPDAEYSGLDARDALPPLIRPDLLMDWDAWWECERLAVNLLTSDVSPQEALARLRAAVRDVESWSAADGALLERVRSAFETGRRLPANVPATDLAAAVHAAIPADLVPPAAIAEPRPTERAVCRFLAAHAFANWPIHVGVGLRVWLRSIEAAGALIDTGLGVRAADLRLRHLADTQALCDALAKLG
jgi:Fe-S-cluster containining protein